MTTKYMAHIQCFILLMFVYCSIDEDAIDLQRIHLQLYPLFIVVIACTFVWRLLWASKMTEKVTQNQEKHEIIVNALLLALLETAAIYLFGVGICYYSILYIVKGQLVFVGLCLVFQTDHGALLVGSRFGKTPINQFYCNKTIEGGLGGIGFGVMSAIFMKIASVILISSGNNVFTKFDLSFTEYITLGIGVGVSSIFGDLFESYLKRGAGVKDSGKMFPGHGGMFDRIDSVLMSAPFLLYYYMLGIDQ